MKYIFMTGAPGSKWSSVSKNIYYSPDIDRSDYTENRLYYHDAMGYRDLMHMGAYFDPGMEFGDFFDNLSQHSRSECEAEFDRPFTGSGVRIIKSHVFAHQIDFLKATWPDCPVILIHRSDDACLGWWVKCGHFDITYPLYNKYYVDLKHMARQIQQQNADIMMQWLKRFGYCPTTNQQLAEHLKIAAPPAEYKQYYPQNDIKVMVI